jgi:hypothetical protein
MIEKEREFSKSRADWIDEAIRICSEANAILCVYYTELIREAEECLRLDKENTARQILAQGRRNRREFEAMTRNMEAIEPSDLQVRVR